MGKVFFYPSAQYFLFSNSQANFKQKKSGPEEAVLYVKCQNSSQITELSLAAYMIPEHRRPHPSFPKIRPHAPDTMQTPSRRQLSFLGKLKQSMWAIGKRLKEGDAKYAIKAGMATAILAAPAFFDATRPTFVKYWGDWALISVRFLPFLILSS